MASYIKPWHALRGSANIVAVLCADGITYLSVCLWGRQVGFPRTSNVSAWGSDHRSSECLLLTEKVSPQATDEEIMCIYLRASRGKIIALFFFAKKKRGTKEKTAAYICLLGSNVLPLLLRNSRFTLIPPKIYDIKTNLYTRAAGVRTQCADGITYLAVS